ncbi:hypothetical protein F2P81_013245 [Scophthalmus maximus]|uniref:Ubiquitin carboxyl-terminal hydrolase 48 n=1 Tax=Scophthalmus maximus TaxID=52904 RepID=A0A6A4SQ86_SCOMX|nr:hypothetical protein F2P81_013245 [Scophthalmus maximus]
MAPRIQLEKAAWRWVESVKPEEIGQQHIELAYRVNLPACKRGACRYDTIMFPSDCLCQRVKKTIASYMDEALLLFSVLQLGDTGKVGYGTVSKLNIIIITVLLMFNQFACTDYEPESICEHLQYLFALLQNSNRKYIDPSGLVKALGLDTGQQQDAQEFSKLFLSLLEDTLSKQKDPNLQNIIQRQFCGQFSYVTVCNQCGRSSALPSRFYELELNIQGHKNLTECVTEFLKEEKLDGENRYFCESCQSKQSATRRIKLHSLPPTLNLQLMRFVFDRQTGHKKKLNTFISFPEQLDMGPFLEGKEDQKCVYELSAVLIHRGISAYSGHYIAHVKDARTGDWYKFNDEEIEKMEGKKLQLGIEEDIAETVKSQTRKPKCSKGYHCSRNAYMLVYKVQEEEESSDPSRTNVQVPAFLQRLVDQDNHKFEEWCSEMADMRKQSVDKGKAKHEEVKELYELLPTTDGEPYEFIPLDWLKKWLDDSTATKEVDNSLFLCSHGKLHPDKVGDSKRVSMQAAELLYERYGGGPRLDESSLCSECVGQRCRVLRLKNQLNEDYKEVSNLVKRTLSGEGYWVGKASLRSWRQLALEQLEEDEHGTKYSNGQTNGLGPHISSRDFGSELSEGNEDDMKTFNEDIVCTHGGLSILETERKLVSSEVWNKLRVYFSKAPEFNQNQESCHQCLGSDVLYVVPLFFVDEWRKFIRRPTKSSPVSNVGNTLLLCPHGGFMFTYDSLIGGDAQHIALLWPNEWEVISRLFIVDQAISIHCFTQTTPGGPSPRFTTQPDLCWECRESFLFQQQRDLREYTQATIYIRKVIEDKRMIKEAAPEMTASSSEAEEEKEEHPKVDGERDPDFSQSQDGAKRLKLCDDGAVSAPAVPVTNMSNMTKLGGIRRSTRHRKLRGEKALIVSANQTLKELKIQIMHAFSVAPFDQNLSIDGKSLTDDSATLGSLGIIPECIICLKARGFSDTEDRRAAALLEFDRRQRNYQRKKLEFVKCPYINKCFDLFCFLHFE